MILKGYGKKPNLAHYPRSCLAGLIKTQSGYPILWPRFEPEIFRIRRRSGNQSTATLGFKKSQGGGSGEE
jgi:hypothetical protein